jgi:hypothetical protein
MAALSACQYYQLSIPSMPEYDPAQSVQLLAFLDCLVTPVVFHWMKSDQDFSIEESALEEHSS